MGRRLTEEHLYPEEHKQWINKVVEDLASKRVSAEDLENFSGALHILDSLTAACLRPQDSLGCLACQAYMKNGRLVFVLPPKGKNSVSLARNVNGMVVNHAKSERTTGKFISGCVVLLYIWIFVNLYIFLFVCLVALAPLS